MIHIENLTKKYPIIGKHSSWKTSLAEALRFKEKEYLTALDNVSLHVRRGEIFGILGPNGAGKTTLLKIVAGLLLPESGSVTVNNFDIIKQRNNVRNSCTFLRSGGWVIFDYKYPIYKNLEFWAVIMGTPLSEAKKNVDKVLSVVGLEDKRRDYPENLSAGMRQKMNLARCLLAPRPVYLLDEPTSHIDAYSADFIRGFIRDEVTNDGNTAVVLATHNLWEAEMMCDRIAILDKGRILVTGPTEEIKKRLGKECLVLVFDHCPKQLIKHLLSLDFILDVSERESSVKILGRDLKRNLSMVLDICKMYAKVNYVDITSSSLNEIFIQLMKRGD